MILAGLVLLFLIIVGASAILVGVCLLISAIGDREPSTADLDRKDRA